jgi:hypothetical protein
LAKSDIRWHGSIIIFGSIDISADDAADVDLFN